MRLSIRTVSNGLFLIFLGVVFLLLNFGILNWNFWGSFIEFWPVVLIVIGVGLLFNRRIPVSLAFLLLGIVMVVVSLVRPPAERPFFFGNQSWSSPAQESKRSIDFPLSQGLDKGRVSIDAGGAKINIASTSQGFAGGEITTYYGEPTLKYQADSGKLTIASPGRKKIARNKPEIFDLKLTDQLPLKLDISAGAVSGVLDFSKIKLSELDINLGAGDVEVKFGPTGFKTQGTIKSGASNIVLVVPKDVGLRLKFSGALANIDTKGRPDLVKEERTYTSGNFSTASSTLDLNMSVAVSNIEILSE